jgi:putative ABC transport system permease protein
MLIARMTCRALLSRPALVLGVTAVVTLGVAANAALYSVLDQLLFRPPPVREPETIFHFRLQTARLFALPSQKLVEHATLMEERIWGSEFSGQTRVSLETPFERGQGAPVDWGLVPAIASVNLCTLFGVQPVAGRCFEPSDVNARPRAVLLGERLWEERFGRDLDAIERIVEIPGSPPETTWRIVGVLPRSFNVPKGVNFWAAGSENRSDGLSIPTYARSQAGVSIETLRHQFPYLEIDTLIDHLRPDGVQAFRVLLGAALATLLLAWFHLAGLLVSRTMSRSREIGTHLALGGTRRGLVAQFLLEGGMLLLPSLLLAWLLVPTFVRALVLLLPTELTAGQVIKPDAWAFAFAGVLCLSALVPLCAFSAWTAFRRPAADLLRAAGLSPVRFRVVSGLGVVLAAQIALTASLLYTTALAVRSFTNVITVDLGFDSSHMLAVHLPRFDSPQSGARQMRVAARLHHEDLVGQSVTQAARIPGIQGACTAWFYPMQPEPLVVSAIRSEQDVERTPIDVRQAHIGPGCASVFGLRFRTGAEPSRSELAALRHPPGGVGAAIVTESLAARLRSFGDVVGQVVVDRRLQYKIVGIVQDVRIGAPDEAAMPTLLKYAPEGAAPLLLTRAADNSARSPDLLLSALAGIWQERAPRRLIPVDTWIQSRASDYRARMIVMAVIAALAAVLMVAGLKAGFTYAFRNQDRDTAVRLALGGTPGRLRLAALSLVGIVVATGLLIGLVFGLVGAAAFTHLTFGVQGADWVSVSVVAPVVVLLSLMSAAWPVYSIIHGNLVTTLKDVQ